MPLLAINNFKKYSKVDLSLFEIKLEMAKLFIVNYNFPSTCENTDTIYNYNYVKEIYDNLIKLC
jgi:hypothetical protein